MVDEKHLHIIFMKNNQKLKNTPNWKIILNIIHPNVSICWWAGGQEMLIQRRMRAVTRGVISNLIFLVYLHYFKSVYKII